MKPFQPPVAVVTRGLIIACVAIELVLLVAGGQVSDFAALKAGLVPGRVTGAVIGLPGSVPAPLTLVTSLFLHAGMAHLFFNMVFLAWVGRHVEWVVGRWRFLLLYFASGIAGGLLEVAMAPASPLPVIGASSAIAGVFGAYAVLFARSRAAGRRVLGVTVSAEVATATWYAAVWIGLQLLIGLAFNSGPGALGIGGVAIWAHIGGFVTGLIFAQPFVRGPRIDAPD